MGNLWLLASEYPLRDVSLPRDLGPAFLSCDACFATLDKVRGRTTTEGAGAGAGAGARVTVTVDDVFSIEGAPLGIGVWIWVALCCARDACTGVRPRTGEMDAAAAAAAAAAARWAASTSELSNESSLSRSRD